jgi:hypothetical protein
MQAYFKKYREDNKENLSAYAKNYYIKHKDDLLGKMNEKKECECCHRIVSAVNMNRHKLTKYCKNRTVNIN